MIGQWDNNNCVFAVLPICLKLGSNPEKIIGNTVNNGVPFPIYSGPASDKTYKANLYSEASCYEPATGEITWNPYSINGTQQPYILRSDNNQQIDWSNNSEFTIISWMNLEENMITYSPVVFSQSTHLSTPTIGTPYSRMYLCNYISNSNKGYVQLYIKNCTDNNLDRSNCCRKREDGFAPTRGVHMYSAIKCGQDLKVFLDTVECTVQHPTQTYLPYTFGNKYNGPVSYIDYVSVSVNKDSNNVLWASQTQSIQFYNKSLSQQEIDNLYALGPTLGGLKGYDSNGVLNLYDPNAENSNNLSTNNLIGMSNLTNTVTITTDNYISNKNVLDGISYPKSFTSQSWSNISTPGSL